MKKSQCIWNSSRSLVSLIINKVLRVTVIVLGPELTKLPTSEEETSYLVDIYYENHGFPQCLGAIDGKYSYSYQRTN